MTRLERLGVQLEEPLLVTKAINVRYLCGLQSSNAALLVQPDGPTRLFTDFRYVEKARGVEGVELVETKRSLVKDLAELLSGTVGFEAAHISYDSYKILAEGPAELVPRVGIVEGLRAVKDEDEIAAIRRAAQLADEGFRRLAASPFVGRTERDLAWQLEKSFRDLGADGSSFPAIVAAGPNGALPHANPGERVVERGQLVVVDAGCVVDGYCSDCTRTYSTGGLPDELAAIYEICLAAQLASLEAVLPGAEGVAVDAVAREPISAAGYGEAFAHGLGHGVGLEIHEMPTLSTLSVDTLAVGNIVTVEPGIYLPGLGGVRIEDFVVVREGGPEVLTHLPKELTEVG
ncbi:MAG: M24 family metallopeptidase [Gaiellaceae bacterium]